MLLSKLSASLLKHAVACLKIFVYLLRVMDRTQTNLANCARRDNMIAQTVPYAHQLHPSKRSPDPYPTLSQPLHPPHRADFRVSARFFNASLSQAMRAWANRSTPDFLLPKTYNQLLYLLNYLFRICLKLVLIVSKPILQKTYTLSICVFFFV